MEVELKRLQQEVTSPLTSMLVHLQTHKHSCDYMSPPPAPCPSKSSVCAALPGFNQSAGDLAHYRLLELSLVKLQPHMAFDREWATG